VSFVNNLCSFKIDWFSNDYKTSHTTSSLAQMIAFVWSSSVKKPEYAKKTNLSDSVSQSDSLCTLTISWVFRMISMLQGILYRDVWSLIVIKFSLRVLEVLGSSEDWVGLVTDVDNVLRFHWGFNQDLHLNSSLRRNRTHKGRHIGTFYHCTCHSWSVETQHLK